MENPMHDAMTRRSALCGLAALPIIGTLATHAQAHDGPLTEEERRRPWHPRTFGEFHRGFQQRFGTALQDAADCFAKGEKSQVVTGSKARPAVGQIGLHPFAVFVDGAITIAAGFVNDTKQAELAHYGMLGDLATAGVLTLAASSTPCYRGFCSFALAPLDDVRRIIAPRVEAAGIAWDSWESQSMPWHDWRKATA
jgi:hypothetical protein